MPVGIYPRTETHCENISDALKGNRNLGIYSRTKKHIEINRKTHLGISTKGWKMSKKGKQNIGLAMEQFYLENGTRKHLKETKEKISQTETGKLVSEKTKEKIRRKRIKYLQTHKGNFKNTDIELITEKELNKCCALDIINYYEKQKRIKRYIVDFYIPKLKLIIECNGKFWHKGFIRKVKDMRRKETLEKMGYKILVLWDSEIKSKNFNLGRYLN